jgi:hypothetical protein
MLVLSMSYKGNQGCSLYYSCVRAGSKVKLPFVEASVSLPLCANLTLRITTLPLYDLDIIITIG